MTIRWTYASDRRCKTLSGREARTLLHLWSHYNPPMTREHGEVAFHFDLGLLGWATLVGKAVRS